MADQTGVTPDFAALLPHRQIEQAVAEWIDADMPSFDVGALVFPVNQIGTAHLYMKSPGVFAGRPFFDAVFRATGCEWEWNEDLAVEGSYINPKTMNESTGKVALATVNGPVARILQGERTALNTLSRCSGVATAARAAVQVARDCGWKGWVAGTRKTTPGSFRTVEKYGLLVGVSTSLVMKSQTCRFCSLLYLTSLFTNSGSGHAPTGPQSNGHAQRQSYCGGGFHCQSSPMCEESGRLFAKD